MAIRAFTATFTGAEDSIAVSFTGISSSTPAVSAGAAMSDGAGAVDADVISVSSAGCTVVPSARFVGVVELVVMDV